MIHALTIQGAFAHHDRHFTFGPGLTAITGPNGSGKSEILDMIRFALFGAPALRTSPTDYKKTRVSLEFSVRGVRYTVERSTANAKLLREGDTLATGTRPVNDKVKAIFGYDLSVFDTSHAVTQGALLQLLSARPADRKRLVDQTVGLSTLTELIDQCKKEASALLPHIEALETYAAPPPAPVPPPAYRPAALLSLRRDRLREGVRLREAVAKALAREPERVETPVWAHSWTLEDVEEHEAQRRALAAQVAALRKILAPPPRLTREEIVEQEYRHAVAESRAALQNLPPRPDIPREELAGMERQLDEYDCYRGWKELSAKGSHTCPKCKHEWFVAQEEMERYGDWKGREAPPKPKLPSLLAIHQKLRAWDDYDHAAPQREQLGALPALPAPTHSRAALEEMKRAHAQAETREQAEVIAAHLATLPDRGGDALLWKKHLVAVAQAQAAQARHAEWEALRPRRLGQLQRTEWMVSALLAIDEAVTAAHTYEAETRAWERAVALHRDAAEKLTTLRATHQEWRGAAAALESIRARVKNHLTPSLSRAASSLLTRMTAGALNELMVSEDFDVTVDGLEVEALSGAGKAAANLALRIALGYVLTNRVFSVLLADEVDAGMDEERAGAAAAALRNLTTSLGQVVLVTHKTPAADHYIRL